MLKARPQLFYRLTAIILLVALSACQHHRSELLEPIEVPTGAARLNNTVVYSNDFEGSSTGWSVYVWGWMDAYATTYVGSKRLDVANLMSRARPNGWVSAVYQTDIPLTAGNYLMNYTTITTTTKTPNAKIEIRLVESAGIGTTPTEKLIGSIALKSRAVPLSKQKLRFSVAENTQQCALKIVSVGNTTIPTEAGHCYLDNISIVR